MNKREKNNNCEICSALFRYCIIIKIKSLY